MTQKKKTAFITGITGQDGSYLARYLIEKNYNVHGLIRRSSSVNTDRINDILPKIELHFGDMTDSSSLTSIINKTNPDEIYNLAAQGNVGVSFGIPEYTADTDGLGCLRILECIKTLGLKEKTRFYQASTSEIFGNTLEKPQSETTPFDPKSPYAAAKLFAHNITKIYREAYGIHASNGILFNHESPARGEDFVTRKITKAVAAIKYNKQDVLELGNLDARRDWGHAKDYVRGIWLMLQQDNPDDYILATGLTESVRCFVEKSFKYINVSIEWEGKAEQERGIDAKTRKTLVRVCPKLYRPLEVHHLVGNASKAKSLLGWTPEFSLDMIIDEMMRHDLAAFE